MSNDWVNDVGVILESKKGKLYIKIDKDLTLKEGDNLILKKKSDEIKASLESGKIDEAKCEDLLTKLSFIKYSIHKPPRDNS